MTLASRSLAGFHAASLETVKVNRELILVDDGGYLARCRRI